MIALFTDAKEGAAIRKILGKEQPVRRFSAATPKGKMESLAKTADLLIVSLSQFQNVYEAIAYLDEIQYFAPLTPVVVLNAGLKIPRLLKIELSNEDGSRELLADMDALQQYLLQHFAQAPEPAAAVQALKAPAVNPEPAAAVQAPRAPAVDPEPAAAVQAPRAPDVDPEPAAAVQAPRAPGVDPEPAAAVQAPRAPVVDPEPAAAVQAPRVPAVDPEPAALPILSRCITIAVAGAGTRIGTTTQALQALLFLSKSGYKAALIEMVDKPILPEYTSNAGTCEDYYTVKGLHLFRSKNSISRAKEQFEFLVLDYGDFSMIPDQASFMERDYKIICTGIKPQEAHSLSPVLEKDDGSFSYCFSFVPPMDHDDVISLMRHKLIYFAPSAPDYWQYVGDDSFYKSLLGIAPPVRHKPKLFSWKKR